MAVLTRNFEYQGPLYPVNTLVPPELNSKVEVRVINATTYTANIYSGLLLYYTGTTNASDLTEAPANAGGDDLIAKLYLCRLDHGRLDQATTTTTPLPGLIPHATDVSGTIANYKFAANTSIKVTPVNISMKLWVMGSQDATWDTTFNYNYYPAAAGLIEASGDPDGTTAALTSHCFRSCATTTNNNWCLVEYQGFKTYDDTA
jgi:hypothetical protein